MSIIFKQVIMHTLDASLDRPLLSKQCLTLTDDTEAYITSYVVGLFENHSMAKAVFEDSSPWLEVIKSGIKDFYSFSCDMAHQFFAYLQTFENIPSGDLIVTQFERDAVPYVAFIKLNYKEAYTHAMDHSVESNQIIKHKSIFPESTSKIQEAAIINIEKMNILLLDTHKEKYVHTLLGCTAPLSTKQKINVVEKVITEAIEENFENKIEALSFAKSNLAKSIESTSSIM
ncbi:MAG: nucleoid-associated protein, partial [Clostridiales bacterium]|nr:nucleoid-associated protein [Clostridiales bacterium]